MEKKNANERRPKSSKCQRTERCVNAAARRDDTYVYARLYPTFDNSNSTHARREVQRPVYQSLFRHSRSKSHLPCNRYALAPRNPDTCQKHDRRPNKEFTWNVRIYTHRQSVKRRRLAATSGIREISGNASLRWSTWRYVPPANKETRARETSNDDPNGYSDASSIVLNKKKFMKILRSRIFLESWKQRAGRSLTRVI